MVFSFHARYSLSVKRDDPEWRGTADRRCFRHLEGSGAGLPLTLHERHQAVMRRFFVDPADIQGKRAVLSESDARHIQRVLRMREGERLVLFDGRGMKYIAEITALCKSSVEVLIVDQYALPGAPIIPVTLAQGILKDKKMDALIRQVTELGISRWIPFFAQRSVPKPDEKRLFSRRTRWHKIAVEAMKQCGRPTVPEIMRPLSFSEVLKFGVPCDLPVIFWENATMPVSEAIRAAGVQNAREIFLMMGPEGGFSQDEIESAMDSGFCVASLGPRILRAETATLAACSVIQYLFGDMGSKNA